MKRYPTYRDSCIEWIREIPEHWETVRLKQVVQLNSQKLPEDVKAEYKFKYIDISNVTYGKLNSEPELLSFKYAPSRARRIVRKGDTIISTVRTYLKAITFIDQSLDGEIASTGFAVLSPNKDVCQKFLFYSTSSNIFIEKICAISVGVSYPAANASDIGKLSIPFPPKSEQTQIANFLDHKTQQIDSLIEKKKRLIELLKEERTAIINQAVTKGLPAEARVKEGLDPDVPMKDSDIEWIGEIPEHWGVKKLKHVLKNLDHRRIPISSSDRGEMKNKQFDYYGASGIIDKVDEYIFEGDHILIGEDGANLLTRNSPLAFKAKGKYWVNNHAHILQPYTGDIDYFTYLLEEIDYTIFVTGSAQPKLTQEALSNIYLLEPSFDEQKRIVNYINTKCDVIKSSINKVKHEIDLYSEYKSALINEAVTGKIDVREYAINNESATVQDIEKSI